MSHSRAVFLMIVVALLWSMAGVVTRHLDSAASFEVTFWRSAFGGLALGVALTVMRGPSFWGGVLHSSKFIWISGICWSIMFTSFMVAITLTTVANVLVVMALGPLFTAGIARLFLHHRLPALTWMAIAVAGFGIVRMFLDKEDATFTLVGSIVSLGVPLAAAVNFTTLQHVSLGKVREMIDSAPAPVLDLLPAVLIGAILSALVTLPLSWPFQASAHDLGLLSLLGIFQLAVPCLLIVRLSRQLSAPEISLLAQLEVIFGVTWAWIWAGEHLSANTVKGCSLVLGALVANEIGRILRERKIKAQNLRYAE